MSLDAVNSSPAPKHDATTSLVTSVPVAFSSRQVQCISRRFTTNQVGRYGRHYYSAPCLDVDFLAAVHGARSVRILSATSTVRCCAHASSGFIECGFIGMSQTALSVRIYPEYNDWKYNSPMSGVELAANINLGTSPFTTEALPLVRTSAATVTVEEGGKKVKVPVTGGDSTFYGAGELVKHSASFVDGVQDEVAGTIRVVWDVVVEYLGPSIHS